MASEAYMRDVVYHLSDTESWHKRVAKMSQSQIFAIYQKQQNSTPKTPKKDHRNENPDIPF